MPHRPRPALALLVAPALLSGCQLLGPTAPTTRNAKAWEYEVTAGSGAVDLTITAQFPKGSDRHFIIAERAETFVVGVEVEQADRTKPWREVRRLGSEWLMPECVDGCRMRYRYLLADGAGSWGDIAVGSRAPGVIEAPPSTWLLRPQHTAAGTPMRFHVNTVPGESFVTGVFAAPDVPTSAGIYEAHVGDYLQLPYSAFGQLRVHELADATVAIMPGAVPEALVLTWVEMSLKTVRAFYGKLPVPHVLILVKPSIGDDVGSGMTMGFSGASIAINVGEHATIASFRHDWVLVHELVHTALPDMPEEQRWLEEGLATYVEPLARYRQGLLSLSNVWTEWALRMKQGEPETGDLGLDETHTWARTYWGGALFCLTADVEIRARTKGKASLDDALRGIQAAGGNIAVSWTMDKIIEVGDRATGTTVLRETYDKQAKQSSPVDLPALWRRLGVVLHEDDTVTYDDHAELAWVRNAMTPPRTDAASHDPGAQ